MYRKATTQLGRAWGPTAAEQEPAGWERWTTVGEESQFGRIKSVQSITDI